MDRQIAPQPMPPEDSSGGSIPDAELLLYKLRTQPQTKRWTARVKTGCNTCRARHVKCDEQRPVCKQCTVARRQCTGYIYGNDFSSETAWPELVLEPVPSPSKGLDPTDWPLQEACQYYVKVQAPMNNYTSVGASPFQASYDAAEQLRKGGMETHSFIAMVTQHRIICSANAVKVAPRYGKIPEMNHVWQMLYGHMAATVNNVNGYIKAGARPSYIIYQIVNLLGIELGLSISTWRLHAEGFAGFIRRYGGMENMMTLKLGTYTWIQYGFILATACNTTSPPADQIIGVLDWSRKEVQLAYSHTGREMFPCPTALFLEIIEITRLRLLVYTGERSRTQLFRKALKIAHAVNEFEPETWTESYETCGSDCFISARLFKMATKLYALLSLPPHLGKLFAQQPAIATVAPRVYYRDILFELFAEAWDGMSRTSLGWPSAVLGVAVVDSPEQREQLCVWLDYMRWIPSTDGGTHNLMPLLNEFWVSGKSGWDDCFYKPTNCLL